MRAPTSRACRSSRILSSKVEILGRWNLTSRCISGLTFVALVAWVAEGSRPLCRDRFVKIAGATEGVDWSLVERARQLAGLKGSLANLPTSTMNGAAVIGAYHDLWRVEQRFGMTKPHLRARPIFHHQRHAIEAHLLVVFAAVVVARHLQDATGVTIDKVVRTLRPLRTVTIAIGGHTITADPGSPPTPAASSTGYPRSVDQGIKPVQVSSGGVHRLR